MHSKIRLQSDGGKSQIHTVKPLVLHDVTNPTASANAASRRRMLATRSAAKRPNTVRQNPPSPSLF
jgi:hypothetical protein